MARRWLDAGEIGSPPGGARDDGEASAAPTCPPGSSSGGPAGGGVLMYSAIHGVDRLRWLLDSEVATVTRPRPGGSHPRAKSRRGWPALLTFSSGAVATLSANAPLYRAQPRLWETELYGSEGMLRLRTRQWAELSSDRHLERVETHPLSEELGPPLQLRTPGRGVRVGHPRGPGTRSQRCRRPPFASRSRSPSTAPPRRTRPSRWRAAEQLVDWSRQHAGPAEERR